MSTNKKVVVLTEKQLIRLIKKIIIETETPTPAGGKPTIDMNDLFKRNPLLGNLLQNKNELIKNTSNLDPEKQLESLVDYLNKKNPNFKAKKQGGLLNFEMKNPFVGSKLQSDSPIKISGNADIQILPKPNLNKITVQLTIPF